MRFLFEGIKGCRLRIHPLLIPLLFLFWQYGDFRFFMCLLLFVSIHELSHCGAALLFQAKIKEIWITPIGERAVIHHFDGLPYWQRQAVLMAGPICSFVLCGICYFVKQFDFSTMNVIIGGFNILPFLPLDGGKFLLNYWGRRSGTLKAAGVLTRISRGFGYFIIVIGIVQVILYPFSFSLLLIGCYMVSVNRREYLRITYGLYKQLMQKKKNTPLPIRACYTGENTLLGDLTAVMNPDYYFLFYRRHNGKMEQKTQQEIMSLLMERGASGRVWE